MRRLTMRAMRAVVGLAVSAAVAGSLAGCLLEPSSRPRTEGSCFIGGCASELCSDQPDLVSPCIWRDAYACFRDATCERQSDGACGWTQTQALQACLASHDPLPGAPPRSQP
jgi:hypothetical protein